MKYKLITLSFLALLCIGFAASSLSDNETAYCSSRSDLQNISDCASFWATMHSINPVTPQNNYSINMSDYITLEQFDNWTNGTFYFGRNYSNFTGNFTMNDVLIAMRDSGIFSLTANVPVSSQNQQQNLSYQQQQTYSNNPNYAQTSTTTGSSSDTIVILMFILIFVIIGAFAFIIIQSNKKKQVPPILGNVYPVSTYERHGPRVLPQSVEEFTKMKEEEDNLRFAQDRENSRKKGG